MASDHVRRSYAGTCHSRDRELEMKAALQRAFGIHRAPQPRPAGRALKWSRERLAGQFPEISGELLETIFSVQHLTMTSPERIFAFCDAIRHIVHNGIAGDIVE